MTEVAFKLHSHRRSALPLMADLKQHEGSDHLPLYS